MLTLKKYLKLLSPDYYKVADHKNFFIGVQGTSQSPYTFCTGIVKTEIQSSVGMGVFALCRNCCKNRLIATIHMGIEHYEIVMSTVVCKLWVKKLIQQLSYTTFSQTAKFPWGNEEWVILASVNFAIW